MSTLFRFLGQREGTTCKLGGCNLLSLLSAQRLDGLLTEYVIRLRDAANTTVDVLRVLVAIVSVYLMYQRDQDVRNGNGQARVQRGAQDANVLDVDVPQPLHELRALFNQVSALPAFYSALIRSYDARMVFLT